MTGVRFPGSDNVIKHLDIITEMKPKTKRIWVTYDPAYPNSPLMLKVLREAVSSKGITLLEAPNTKIEGLQADLQSLATHGNIDIDAILLLPEGFSQSPNVFKVIIEFANKNHIMVGGGLPWTLDFGAVFSFTPDEFEMGKMAAPLTDKIFKGIPAGTIPLVTPENQLCLNYKASQALGLQVSEGLLAGAVKIIR